MLLKTNHKKEKEKDISLQSIKTILKLRFIINMASAKSKSGRPVGQHRELRNRWVLCAGRLIYNRRGIAHK